MLITQLTTLKTFISRYAPFIFLLILLLGGKASSAQEVTYTNTNTYYANPFEGGSAGLGNFFTYRTNASSADYTVTSSGSSPIDGSYSLRTVNRSSSFANAITARLLPSNGAYSATATYEWSFLYRYTSADANATDIVDYANVVAGKSGWRMWLAANNTTPSANNGKGIYVTQVGKALQFVYKGGDSDYRTMPSTATLSPGITYTIKIRIIGDNIAAMFVNEYTTTKKDATTKIGTFNPGSMSMGSYTYTVHEANEARSTTSLYCQWDNFKLYIPFFNISAITSTSNGLNATTVGQGQKNVIIYGFSVTSRGVYNINTFGGNPSVQNTLTLGAGNANSVLSGAKLYSSTDNNFSTLTDVPITTITPSSSSNLSTTYAFDVGGTDETGTVTYYFYAVDVATNSLLTTFRLSNLNITYDNYNGSSSSSSASTTGPTYSVSQTYIWNSNSNTTWATPGNWKLTLLYQNDVTATSLPATGGYYYVPNSASADPTISSAVNAAYIGVESSRTLNVYDANLTVTSGMTIDGTLGVSGFNNTAVTLTSGKLVTVNNLTIVKLNSTAATLSSGNAMMYLSGTLNAAFGTLATNGALTLTSTATGTATVAQINPSYAAVTGNVTVQRYITGGTITYRGYRLLSSPVHSGTTAYYDLGYIKGSGTYLSGNAGGGFDVTGNPALYLYRPDRTPSNASFFAGNYRPVTAINNSPNAYLVGTADGDFNLGIGNGYLLFYRGNNSTVATAIPNSLAIGATGTLNQGDVQVKPWFSGLSTLNFSTVTGNTAVKGFHLVGNPYASTIDWEQMGTNASSSGIYTTDISTKIYIVDPVTQNYSTYQKGGASTLNGSRYIPSGQGFFVSASTANAQITFKESAKVANQVTGTSLLLNTAVNDNDDRHIRVQLYKEATVYDDCFIGFKQNASAAYNYDEDAPYKKGNGKVSLSSLTSDKEAMAINYTPLITSKQTIPLNFTVTTTGTYQLNTTEIKNVPELFDIWLYDGLTKDSLDIRHNKTYSFNTSADTNSYGANRFKIVIRQNPDKAVRLLAFSGSKAEKGVNLNWTVENEANYTRYSLERSVDGGKTYKVIDSLTSVGLGTYHDLDPYPVTGLNQYRLKQTDVLGKVSYSAIVPIMYSPTASTVNLANNLISIYPNPVINTVNLAIKPLNDNAANYKITITNSMGLIVQSATTANVNWQSAVDKLLPGTYFVQVLNAADNTVTGKSTFIKL